MVAKRFLYTVLGSEEIVRNKLAYYFLTKTVVHFR